MRSGSPALCISVVMTTVWPQMLKLDDVMLSNGNFKLVNYCSYLSLNVENVSSAGSLLTLANKRYRLAALTSKTSLDQESDSEFWFKGFKCIASCIISLLQIG